MKDPKVLLTGPGIEKNYTVPMGALSAAINKASRAKDESTFYVWVDDKPYGRTERDADGNVFVYRTAVAA